MMDEGLTNLCMVGNWVYAYEDFGGCCDGRATRRIVGETLQNQYEEGTVQHLNLFSLESVIASSVLGPTFICERDEMNYDETRRIDAKNMRIELQRTTALQDQVVKLLAVMAA